MNNFILKRNKTKIKQNKQTNKQKTPSKYFLGLGTLKSTPNKNGIKIYTYIWLFILPIRFIANKNKFKGGIWFLKRVLSFSSAASWSGWDGGTDLWLLTPGSESPWVLLHPRQYPGIDRGCQGEEQVGRGRHKPPPCPSPPSPATSCSQQENRRNLSLRDGGHHGN